MKRVKSSTSYNVYIPKKGDLVEIIPKNKNGNAKLAIFKGEVKEEYTNFFLLQSIDNGHNRETFRKLDLIAGLYICKPLTQNSEI